MKKFILFVMLLGVTAPHGLAREKYKIMVRKDFNGSNLYYPMKKDHNGFIARTWVIGWPFTTQAEAERRIEEWKLEAQQIRLMNKKEYIYIN